MAETHRLPHGGQINRDRTLQFLFNGNRYQGHPGDTLASALLANGVLTVGCAKASVRRRGILSTRRDDPAVRVSVGVGARVDPTLSPTEVELYDGMIASSVHGMAEGLLDRLAWQVGGLIGPRLASLLPFSRNRSEKAEQGKGRKGQAGLTQWERLEDRLMQRLIGWGAAPEEADRDLYDHSYRTVDTLVIGAGPSGLKAAQEAVARGERVAILDQDSLAGGQSLLASPQDDRENGLWAAHAWQGLSEASGVTALLRTTAFFMGDGGKGIVHALERRSDHLGPQIGSASARHRFWSFQAHRIVLATGAAEQAMLFAGNDRPGVFLSSAITALIRRWAVLPAQRIAIAACDDSAYQAALAIVQAGGKVPLIVDSRPIECLTHPWISAVRSKGVEIRPGMIPLRVKGARRITGLEVANLAGDGRRSVACDAVAMAGGWVPDLMLWRQAGGAVLWHAERQLWVADSARPPVFSHGKTAAGSAIKTTVERVGLVACDAPQQGHPAAPQRAIGAYIEVAAKAQDLLPGALSSAALSDARIDWHGDLSLGDFLGAITAGQRSFATLARWARLVAGRDGCQMPTGRGAEMGSVMAWRVLEALEMAPVEDLDQSEGAENLADIRAAVPRVASAVVPLPPITIGAVVGARTGALAAPFRLSPMDHWHHARGASWMEQGGWNIPSCFPLAGESNRQAIERECRAAREGATLHDASALGMFDLQGPDVGAFLNVLLTKPIDDMGLARVRYVAMLNDRGYLLSDATVTRLADCHFLLTVPTAQTSRVAAHLRMVADRLPPLRFYQAEVTDQWATLSLGGPRARDILTRLAPDLYLGSKSFPPLSCQDAAVADLPARITRTAFTGEETYEISVPSRRGLSLWYKIFERGSVFGLVPMGRAAVEVLRAERGLILMGHEGIGPALPHALGLGDMVRDLEQVKPTAPGLGQPFIGASALAAHLRRQKPGTGRQLVGLLTEDPRVVLPAGAQVAAERMQGREGAPDMQPEQGIQGVSAGKMPIPAVGLVTSSYYSPTLGRSIALAMVEHTYAAPGTKIHAPLELGRWVTAQVCDPVFHTAEGAV